MQQRNERVVRRRFRRRRLFFWRITLCLCFLSLLFAAARGTAAVIKDISTTAAKPPSYGSVSGPGSSGLSGSVESSRPASAQAASSSPAVSAGLKKSNGAASSSDAPAAGSAPSRQPEPHEQDRDAENKFGDTLFIGDSRTEALRNYDGLDGATYYALKGLMVNTAYTRREISVQGKKMTVMQAAAAQKYGKIYVMLGLNELGWGSMQTFVTDYKKIVRDLRKEQPGARVYLQSILPVSAKKSAGSSVYNNDKIVSYNAAIRKLAAQEGAVFLNVAEAVSSGGTLPDDASVDGVHLNSAYCAKWCEYLRTHAGT